MVSRREQLIEIMQDAAKGETKATLREEIASLRDANKALTATIVAAWNAFGGHLVDDLEDARHVAAFADGNLDEQIKALTGQRDAAEAKLAKVEAAFVEQAKMLKTSTDAGLETLAANARLSAERAEARKREELAHKFIEVAAGRLTWAANTSDKHARKVLLANWADEARSFLASKEAGHAE